MRPGVLVANRFQVRSLLDRGSMGSVWLAHHVELDMRCALKFIEGQGALDPDMRRRFAQEARAAALLRSPHVVQIFDAGTWEGTPYLAMELLEGETLSKRLDRLGRLRPGACVAIAEQVARALTKAHAANVVHRDLKPANIFLARDENSEVVKVLDFGIAKWALPSGGEAVTRYGAMLGTPCYMSPEQARDCRVVDHRADLWSLAVMVYECMTGRLPFESKHITELFLQILSDPLPVPSQVAPGLPVAFDAWWAKAANRDPERRFGTAREMVDALAMSLGVSLGGGLAFADSTTSLPSMTTSNRREGLARSSFGRRVANGINSVRPSRLVAAPRASYVVALSLGIGTLGGGAAAILSTWRPSSPPAAASPAPLPLASPSGRPLTAPPPEAAPPATAAPAPSPRSSPGAEGPRGSAVPIVLPDNLPLDASATAKPRRPAPRPPAPAEAKPEGGARPEGASAGAKPEGPGSGAKPEGAGAKPEGAGAKPDEAAAGAKPDEAAARPKATLSP
ncbi:MAG TPA: serine/threonine-protein kinase [Polyangiaceae bacterium]|nr:serine/threonine-protein kinase [Polyangiaceae bacterium]